MNVTSIPPVSVGLTQVRLFPSFFFFFHKMNEFQLFPAPGIRGVKKNSEIKLTSSMGGRVGGESKSAEVKRCYQIKINIDCRLNLV